MKIAEIMTEGMDLGNMKKAKAMRKELMGIKNKLTMHYQFDKTDGAEIRKLHELEKSLSSQLNGDKDVSTIDVSDFKKRAAAVLAKKKVNESDSADHRDSAMSHLNGLRTRLEKMEQTPEVKALLAKASGIHKMIGSAKTPDDMFRADGLSDKLAAEIKKLK